MQRIILIGGGGFGRELLGYLEADIASGHLRDCQVAGVLDDSPDCELVRCRPDLPYLGSLAGHTPSEGDRFLMALGSVKARVAVGRQLQQRGLHPFTYVHSSVLVARDACIGKGAIVCPQSIVNSGAVIGDHAAINVFCSVGHGAQVGAFSVLSPYSALNGNARIGERCFLGTRSTVYPGVQIGDACVVDSHSPVKATVSDRKIISMRGQYLVLDNRLGS